MDDRMMTRVSPPQAVRRVSDSLNDGAAAGDADGVDGAEKPLSVEAIAGGAFAAVEAIVDGEAMPVVLHRHEDGALRAWLNVCPHAGRRLDWAPGKFLVSKAGQLVCAVHGAGFARDSGLCVAGPCRGQSLQPVAVAVRDGLVLLGDAVAGTPAG